MIICHGLMEMSWGGGQSLGLVHDIIYMYILKGCVVTDFCLMSLRYLSSFCTL